MIKVKQVWRAFKRALKVAYSEFKALADVDKFNYVTEHNPAFSEVLSEEQIRKVKTTKAEVNSDDPTKVVRESLQYYKANGEANMSAHLHRGPKQIYKESGELVTI